MNKEAGRGNWLFVTLRLESGEELLFFVDTGMSVTLLDKSLESKLGKRLGTGRVLHFDGTSEAGIYAAPKLYLGSTLLMTGSNILAGDLERPTSLSGRSIMGVLGMDCLRQGTIILEAHPNSETYHFRKNGDSATCHYSVARASKDSPWKLQKAWRTDQNDHTIEEFPVP